MQSKIMGNNHLSLKHYQREKLDLPENQKKLLLHSCCAPCAAEIMDALKFSEIDTTIYFYNPNIHPKKEYEIRKNENKRYADKIGMDFIDGDYDDNEWFKRVKGLEWEPERGKRCSACFDMRFEKTALVASEKKFHVISSTLGISRWKDMNQINISGIKSASKYEALTYWTFNWRKQGGSQRMLEISKNEKFYMQEYCGCIYSLRDTNKWRKKHQRETISIGKKYYGHE